MPSRAALMWILRVVVVGILGFAMTSKIVGHASDRELAIAIMEGTFIVGLLFPGTASWANWLLLTGLSGVAAASMLAVSRIDFSTPCGCMGRFAWTTGQSLIVIGVLLMLAVLHQHLEASGERS